MIEKPWVILMTSRLKLGAMIYAVAGPKPSPSGKIRRTLRIERAYGFATKRRAEFAARKLNERSPNEVLMTVVRVTSGDFRGPIHDQQFVQMMAFSEESK